MKQRLCDARRFPTKLGKNTGYFLAELPEHPPKLLPLPCPARSCYSHVQPLLGASARLERINGRQSRRHSSKTLLVLQTKTPLKNISL